jgi:hypothetical protein
MPSSQRAGERGDTMLAKANDASLSLGAKDVFYAEAEKYFDFAGFSDEEATAASARAAIQPDLKAQRDRQRESFDQARERLKSEAASARQAAEGMRKTEAEKQAFKNEADALEAELGF